MKKEEKKPVAYYARRDGINERTALRWRKKADIGEFSKIAANGVWLITEKEWQEILNNC